MFYPPYNPLQPAGQGAVFTIYYSISSGTAFTVNDVTEAKAQSYGVLDTSLMVLESFVLSWCYASPTCTSGALGG